MVQYKESFYNIKVCTDERNRVLLFNSYTSALCWIEADVYRAISGKTHIDKENIQQTMVDLGYVVEDQVDEMAKYIFERNHYLYNTNPKVMGYVISPTMKCNMSCYYCFQKDIRHKKSIDVKDLDSIVDFIKVSIENNTHLERFWIKWFGGEPSLEINVIKYITRLINDVCKERNIFFDAMIVSNGLLLTKEVVDDLVHHCNINLAQITLDGMRKSYSKAKGVSEACFDKVIENISYMSDYMKINININVSKQNIKEVFTLIDYITNLKKMNKKNISIYPSMVYKYVSGINGAKIFDEDGYQNFLQELFDYVEERKILDFFEFELPHKRYSYCSSMQSNTLCIGPEGYLYRCETCIGQEDYRVGSCKEGRYFNEIDFAYVSCPLQEKCKVCNLLPICAGGCRDRQLYRDVEQSCHAKKKEIITTIMMYMKKNKEND